MKKYLFIFLQGLGATVGFIVSMILGNALLPVAVGRYAHGKT